MSASCSEVLSRFELCSGLETGGLHTKQENVLTYRLSSTVVTMGNQWINQTSFGLWLLILGLKSL